MFVMAKLLDLLLQPLNLVALLLVLGLLSLNRRPVAARRCLRASLCLLLLTGWQPLPDALLRQLEAQSPAWPDDAPLDHYAGVLVLGGALEPAYLWSGRSQAQLNDAAERMTAALPLMARAPHLMLVFTGGEGELMAQGATQGPSEAQRAQIFYTQMGLPASRLLLEDRSRSTYENALFSAQLPGVDRQRPWLLVTSAWHMPRALATFRHAGWNVTPYPVDYRTGTESTPWSRYALDTGAAHWHLALHELAGLLLYRLTGRA